MRISNGKCRKKKALPLSQGTLCPQGQNGLPCENGQGMGFEATEPETGRLPDDEPPKKPTLTRIK